MFSRQSLDSTPARCSHCYAYVLYGLGDAKSLASSGLSVAALSHGPLPFARLSHTSDLFGQPTVALAWLHSLAPNAATTTVAVAASSRYSVAAGQSSQAVRRRGALPAWGRCLESILFVMAEHLIATEIATRAIIPPRRVMISIVVAGRCDDSKIMSFQLVLQ